MLTDELGVECCEIRHVRGKNRSRQPGQLSETGKVLTEVHGGIGEDREIRGLPAGDLGHALGENLRRLVLSQSESTVRVATNVYAQDARLARESCLQSTQRVEGVGSPRDSTEDADLERAIKTWVPPIVGTEDLDAVEVVGRESWRGFLQALDEERISGDEESLRFSVLAGSPSYKTETQVGEDWLRPRRSSRCPTAKGMPLERLTKPCIP